MNAPIIIAPVRKSVRVKAPVARAFDVFTSGLSRWWRLDHGWADSGWKYRKTARRPALPRSPCGSHRIAW